MPLTRRSALLTLLGATAACASRPASVEDIIARHTEARGGAAAIDAIRSEYAEIAIEERGSRLRGIYQCAKDPIWRIDVYAGGKHVFCEGLDAEGPWLWPEGDAAARAAAPDARRTGLQGIEFALYGLHRFTERGHAVSLAGAEAADGILYQVIRVVMKDSYETFLFINPNSWMIDRRRDFRAFHPDADPTRRWIEKRYGDYRAVSGVMTAFEDSQFDLKTGALVNSSRVALLRYNVDLAPATSDRNFRR